MFNGRTLSIAIGISKAFSGDGEKKEDPNLPPLKPGFKRVDYAGFKDFYKDEIEQQERERIDGSRSK